jgi:TolB-like protein
MRSSELAPQERGPSVIVLPFETLSTHDDDRFLASGMTQQLITDLMRFGAFKLYSVPASLRQNAAADPVHLGRSLAVAYVIKGSIRSDAGLVRVGAQLVDAKTGQVLWSETYDRSLTPDNLVS